MEGYSGRKDPLLWVLALLAVELIVILVLYALEYFPY